MYRSVGIALEVLKCLFGIFVIKENVVGFIAQDGKLFDVFSMVHVRIY